MLESSLCVLSTSGLFALLGVSVYTGVTVNFYGKRYAEWRFSWSYILGWIAVILTISAGISAPRPIPSRNEDLLLHVSPLF